MPASFSLEMTAMAACLGEERVVLGDLLAQTGPRGRHLLAAILSLPFLVPITPPGLSVPFGAIIALLGWSIASGREVWVPSSLARRRITSRAAQSILRGGARIARLLETVLRPRLARIYDRRAVEALGGVQIALAGLFLLLPLPVPLTQFFPGWAVLLLAAGNLGRDALFSAAGTLALLAGAAMLALIGFGALQAAHGLNLGSVQAGLGRNPCPG